MGDCSLDGADEEKVLGGGGERGLYAHTSGRFAIVRLLQSTSSISRYMGDFLFPPEDVRAVHGKQSFVTCWQPSRTCGGNYGLTIAVILRK